MDNYLPTSGGQISHPVELYTERLLVKGDVSGPFKRISDLMNRREPPYVTVSGASMVPVGLAAPPRLITAPVMVQREQIHIVGARPPEDGGQAQGTREFFVAKNTQVCHVFTDTFIIQGTAHLLKDGTLQMLMESGNTFVPITNATIYLVSMPNAPWTRELVLVNKTKIHVLYAAE